MRCTPPRAAARWWPVWWRDWPVAAATERFQVDPKTVRNQRDRWIAWGEAGRSRRRGLRGTWRRVVGRRGALRRGDGRNGYLGLTYLPVSLEPMTKSRQKHSWSMEGCKRYALAVLPMMGDMADALDGDLAVVRLPEMGDSDLPAPEDCNDVDNAAAEIAAELAAELLSQGNPAITAHPNHAVLAAIGAIGQSRLNRGAPDPDRYAEAMVMVNETTCEQHLTPRERTAFQEAIQQARHGNKRWGQLAQRPNPQ